MNTHLRPRLLRPVLCGLALAGWTSQALAQVSFSVDWHSPTVGLPDSFTGVAITEGDVLTVPGFVPAFGPLPVPGNSISGGLFGLGLFGHPGCVGHPGGTACLVELDALSFGTDCPVGAPVGAVGCNYLFSTDEFAVAPYPPIYFPSVGTEAPVGDSSADVWINGMPIPPGPVPPFGAPAGNVGVIDGDGFASGSLAVYPGLGLIEPNFPGFPNLGDNLDAFDWDGTGVVGFPPGGVYFSLDSGFPDPFGPPNSGSALFHGFSGSDVLWTPVPGGPPIVWAPGFLLGLDLLAIGMDDLDALAIAENGSGLFEPSMVPGDWLGGATDMVLFSVRRGSPVVGMPDSIFGLPISEGDILTTPLLGGLSPFPGIYVAAENLGLGTLRSGAPPDDLNALDTSDRPIRDCNGNGFEDAMDITLGLSTDVNGNGVPDDCEVIGGPYCFCPAGVAPCANPYAFGGCRNTSGVGAILGASGSGSVLLDNLVLTTVQLPPGKFGLYFAGPTMIGPFPFGDGLRCAGGGIMRFPPPVLSSPAGVLSLGPGIATTYGLLPFTTLNFQCWYRDPGGPCLSGFNTSNAFSVTFTP